MRKGLGEEEGVDIDVYTDSASKQNVFLLGQAGVSFCDCKVICDWLATVTWRTSCMRAVPAKDLIEPQPELSTHNSFY